MADGTRTRDTKGLDGQLQYLYVCGRRKWSAMFYLPCSTAGYVLLLNRLTYFLTYFGVPARSLYLNRAILRERHDCSLKGLFAFGSA